MHCVTLVPQAIWQSACRASAMHPLTLSGQQPKTQLCGLLNDGAQTVFVLPLLQLICCRARHKFRTCLLQLFLQAGDLRLQLLHLAQLPWAGRHRDRASAVRLMQRCLLLLLLLPGPVCPERYQHALRSRKQGITAAGSLQFLRFREDTAWPCSIPPASARAAVTMPDRIM